MVSDIWLVIVCINISVIAGEINVLEDNLIDTGLSEIPITESNRKSTSSDAINHAVSSQCNTAVLQTTPIKEKGRNILFWCKYIVKNIFNFF